jgi:ABC-type antimicrobial peptide transport system permease subunit
VKRWLPDAIYFLLKDISHDWARTSLTIFGMAVVIFSFFILSAFSQSLNVFNQTTSTSKNLIVIQADLIDPSDAMLDATALQAAEQIPSSLISKVSPVIFRRMRINDHVVQLRAAPVEDWETVFHLRLLEGQWPKESGEVVAGQGASEANGWKIGSTLEIFGSQFRVAGIASLPGSFFSSVWMPLKQAGELFGMKRGYQLMVIQIAPGADVEEVKQRLQQDPQLTGRYTIFYEDSYSKRNNQLFKDIMSLMSITSSIALLAVILGTYSSTNLSLAERGREIGILRAVGFSHNLIGILLSIRAMVQSWIAYAISLTAALGYIAYQQAFAQLFVLGIHITFEITWGIILNGLLITSTMALFGAWLSSRRLLLSDVYQMLKD